MLKRYGGGDVIRGSSGTSGLQYLGNRYYDPETGRFTQLDPIGPAGGLNLYGFAAGDPVNFSDPFGLMPCRLSMGADLKAGVDSLGVTENSNGSETSR